jgi:hypothetical protein
MRAGGSGRAVAWPIAPVAGVSLVALSWCLSCREQNRKKPCKPRATGRGRGVGVIGGRRGLWYGHLRVLWVCRAG